MYARLLRAPMGWHLAKQVLLSPMKQCAEKLSARSARPELFNCAR